MSRRAQCSQELYDAGIFEPKHSLSDFQCFICEDIPYPAYTILIQNRHVRKRKLVCLKCHNCDIYGKIQREEYLTQIIEKFRLKCPNFG